jgi:hypothetical protein
MKIIYGSKSDAKGMGIQVTSKVDEDMSGLIAELTAKGFTYVKSPIPLSFKNKDNTTTSHFYRDGSQLFGLKTIDEIYSFINDSVAILTSYDGTFNATKVFPYVND